MNQRVNKWRVLYLTPDGEGHFRDVPSPSKEAAAWSVACDLINELAALVEVQAIGGE